MVCLLALLFAGAALRLGLWDGTVSTKNSELLAETNC